MIDEKVLDIVMWGEIMLLALSVAVFFLHGFYLYLSSARDTRLTEAGRTSLIRLLEGTASTATADTRILRELPQDVQTTVFLELSKNLAGTGKQLLQRIARETQLIEVSKDLCSSRRWTQRLKGVRLLSQMDEADPLVKRMLHDPHPAVRAEAAEWAASHPTPAIMGDLLELLSDPETLSRFAVQDALLRIGREVVAPLTAFLESHSGRAAADGMRVAAAMAEPAFIPVSLAHSTSGEAFVRGAAAELLGAIGGPEAASRLTILLEDADPEVRAAAANGLGRMRHWPAASRLARMLSDIEWPARRASAMALRSIGAPGILLLRRAAAAPAQRVSDIAQLALDLPAGAR